MRIFSVVGARPQFVKAAALSAVLRQQHSEFLVHTGQHYDNDMSDTFFRQLGIPEPDVNLGIGSGSHAEQTAKMLVPLEQLIQQEHPDWVLVYGDTNSTLAAALAASKIHFPVAHVEAGLRSFNRDMPEEINRVLTDHLSGVLFCPTPLAVNNLAREGITAGVQIVGDIMVDSLLRYLPTARQQSTIHQQLHLNPAAPYVLVTVHRPTNADSPQALAEIIAALNALPMPVIFPVHPRTAQALKTLPLPVKDHVQLISPLGYLDMLCLLASAAVMLTDSGGVQKEAYVLRVPCVTIRPETEWRETVESGWNRLTAAEQSAVQQAVQQALGSPPSEHPDFYGDGTTAQQIVMGLEQAAAPRPVSNLK